jgi:subtilisin family serine protease
MRPVPADYDLVVARLVASLVALVSVLAGSTVAGASEAAARELIVGLAPGVTAAEVGAIRTVGSTGDVVVVRATAAEEARLERSGKVRYAEPNATFRKSATPVDPGWVAQWGLKDRSEVPGSANLEPALDFGFTGAAVTVAVIDTGVSAHSDLTGVLPGVDLITNDGNAADEDGHGTHVAGTIAAARNTTGTTGVAPGVNILPIRSLAGDGTGTAEDLITGIDIAVRRGARVINLSLGGPAEGGTCDAVRKATAAGVLVIAASGNASTAVDYPAACPDAIGVSGTTLDGSIAGYSNVGPEIDLAAPGGDLSVDSDGDKYRDGILGYTTLDGRPGLYFLQGTSMSAPHVAGAAALLLEKDPGLSAAGLRAALLDPAVDLGPAGPDSKYGRGALDIAAALRRITQRLSGPSRYATAATISRAAHPGGADQVYVASGQAFPDALSAGAVASHVDGPLLLTDTCSLPGETAAELSRLRPSQVTVVGGDAAVCQALSEQIAQASGAARVVRVAGPDRFATAVELSSAWTTASTVYLAGGASFPDGLAGGALAASGDGPLLLTPQCSLPTDVATELTRLRPTRIVILGGPNTVCDQVGIDAGAVTKATVVRAGGLDRYATAVAASREGWPGVAPVVFVASGEQFPDGLAGGPLAGAQGGPLLLTPSCSVPPVVAEELAKLKPARIVVLGGPSAVCEGVARALWGAQRG